MLGQGLYFSDRLEKAEQYASNTAFDHTCEKASKIVLICEVALGKMKYVNSFQNIENLAKGYSSVKLRGKREPDPCHTVVLDNGVKVP